MLPAEGLIDQYIKYQGGSSLSNLLPLAKTALHLRRSRFDAVAYLLPTIRSKRHRNRDAWFFRLAGIKRTLGFDGYPDDPFPRGLDGALETVPHEADALLHRLARGGLPKVESGEGCMDMRITPAEQTKADQWFELHRGNELAPRGWFAVCSGSKWSSKKWPAERYQEVGRRLIAQHGLMPVILGGREDRDLGEQLIARWGAGLCAAGDLSVRESAALMRGAKFYLGNDTGVMHLAAAVGRPCVGVFSALDWPGRWYPYGNGHRVLRFDVPCSGCLLEMCNQHNECLRGIEVDRVHDACLEILGC